jgi:hypothetical protein
MPPAPRPPAPAVVRLAAGDDEGPTLADLKALTLGHLEGGTETLVLDLRAAGGLDRRAVGTLMYALTLYHEAGGRLRLCVTPEQRGVLSPYATLFHLTEDGDVTSAPR